jgi:ABC-type Zn uptake system ZnuABC Zn-binding protein ZnuA
VDKIRDGLNQADTPNAGAYAERAQAYKAKLEELDGWIRAEVEKIPAVFAEADFNAKMLEALAKDAGVKVVTNLYDGSLSSGPPADTYINMMRHNVTQMVNALR